MNTLNLLEDSPFRDASQVPLPEDPPVNTQDDDQEEKSKDERDDNPGMRELSEQIDAHVVVLDEENPSSTIPTNTHVVVLDVDKEKALKQVAKANLNEKTLELSSMQRRVTTTENAQEVAWRAVEQLQMMLDETEVKLAEASNVVSAQDKELTDLKETLNNYEQVYYNMGFKDA